MAADALAHVDKAWLNRLITRRVPLERWSEALERRPGDIKVVIDFAPDSGYRFAVENASKEREPERLPERKLV